jgi:hypothetical protein
MPPGKNSASEISPLPPASFTAATNRRAIHEQALNSTFKPTIKSFHITNTHT